MQLYSEMVLRTYAGGAYLTVFVPHCTYNMCARPVRPVNACNHYTVQYSAHYSTVQYS